MPASWYAPLESVNVETVPTDTMTFASNCPLLFFTTPLTLAVSGAGTRPIEPMLSTWPAATCSVKLFIW